MTAPTDHSVKERSNFRFIASLLGILCFALYSAFALYKGPSVDSIFVVLRNPVTYYAVFSMNVVLFGSLFLLGCRKLLLDGLRKEENEKTGSKD